MARNIYIAISSGHTKSVAFAIDSDFNALGCVEGASLSPHMYDVDDVVFRIGSLLDNLTVRIGFKREELLNRVIRGAISIAGAATPQDQALVTVCLARNQWIEAIAPFEIVDDTWAGLISELPSYDGTCAFAGSGASVCFANGSLVSGWAQKIDGWGCDRQPAGQPVSIAG